MDPEWDKPLLVDVPTATRLLACGRTLLYTLVARGEIRAVKLGRATRIPVAELDRYIAGHDKKAA